jgi:FkbM family methyltransferase
MIHYDLPGNIIKTEIKGEEIFFFINNKNDWIQREHLNGKFYEIEDLELIGSYMSSSTKYLDVGANIGNHVIYLNKYVGITDITVIEPNPQAIAILETNLKINNIYCTVDTSFLGYGLSDKSSMVNMLIPMDNLGATRCVEDADGKIKVTTGDTIFSEKTFNFIKIDVEGMEIQCLNGLKKLIDRCRPTIFIEVDNINMQSFAAWCIKNNYKTEKFIKHYQQNQNFLIIPKN